jgi:hypothetical protein
VRIYFEFKIQVCPLVGGGLGLWGLVSHIPPLRPLRFNPLRYTSLHDFTFGSTDILVTTLREDEGFLAHRTIFIAWFGML